MSHDSGVVHESEPAALFLRWYLFEVAGYEEQSVAVYTKASITWPRLCGY